jgi:uncharacterized protein
MSVHVQYKLIEEEHMKALNALAVVLLIVGGLNWGLVALAEFDLVAWLVGEDFGQTNAASRIVYGLVGLAAVYGLVGLTAVYAIAQLASRETSTSTGGARSASTQA